MEADASGERTVRGPGAFRTFWIVQAAMTGLLCLFLLYKAVMPGSWMFDWVFTVGSFLVFVSWLTGLVMEGMRITPGVIAAPVIGVLTVAVLFTGLPNWVGFNISKSAMEKYAQSIMAGTAPKGPQQVGVFTVNDPERIPGGARFSLEGTGGIFVAYGFDYLPTGGFRPTEVTGSVHYGGPWHKWMVDYD
ncbi:hypothetical protein [Sinosporangium siamense]|uniref:Uncharacterized protein n=1 Tax=Sinosporangium siamense TaxID=1367973 RepID=A0A919RMH8_9ACTN|nr:hypothetical protein [Sinosporangium siamense]GII96505.1 hypothetical protein Ssi02_67360 [Sinosporangium siamense]